MSHLTPSASGRGDETTQPTPRENEAAPKSREPLTCPTCGETIDPALGSGVAQLPDLFQRSRVVRRIATALLASISVLSVAAFCFQMMYRLPSGVLYRNTYLAWLDLLGHLLRAACFGFLASSLWAVGRSIPKPTEIRPLDAARFVAIHNRFWNALAATLIAFGLYAVLTFLVYEFWPAPDPIYQLDSEE